MMPWEKALEVAGRLTHPYSIAAFAIVFAGFLFWQASRSRRQGIRPLFYVASALVVVLGLAPLTAATYLQGRGVYRISLIVVDTNGLPTQDAEVLSSEGVVRKANGAWEVEVAPQARSEQRELVLTAQRKQDFVAGTTTLRLAGDYFPAMRIALRPLPPVVIRGIVLDGHQRPVSRATVAVEGYPETAITNAMGMFDLASRAPNGQMVTLVARSEDGMSTARISGPAGDAFELSLRKP